MTKAVSNREICFIKAVLLLCKHEKIENGVLPPPPILIKCLKQIKYKKLFLTCAPIPE